MGDTFMKLGAICIEKLSIKPKKRFIYFMLFLLEVCTYLFCVLPVIFLK